MCGFYIVARNRAIRPCHPSFYVLLALVLLILVIPRGIKGSPILVAKTSDQTRQSWHTLCGSYASPRSLALSSLLAFHSLYVLGRHLLNQRSLSLLYAFYFCPCVSICLRYCVPGIHYIAPNRAIRLVILWYSYPPSVCVCVCACVY